VTPGLVLAADLFLPAAATPAGPPLPGLVVVHGAGSNRKRHETFARTACAEGMAVLALDLRGHGGSGGAVDGETVADVIDATRLLRTHPLVHPLRIGFRGSSMGAYLGVKASQDAEFAALCLLCPAPEAVLLEGLDYLALREDQGEIVQSARFEPDALRQFLERSDIFAAAEGIEAPVLLVHAREDETVPFTASLRLAERLQGDTEVILLAGGDHGAAQRSPALHQRTSRWLKERLSPGFWPEEA